MPFGECFVKSRGNQVYKSAKFEIAVSNRDFLECPHTKISKLTTKPHG
jgi:hypothetical protein